MSNDRMPQITIYAVMLLGLVMAVFLGRSIAEGDIKQVFLVFIACGGVAVFLMLGKYYWMLIPFSFTSGIPAIPIGGKMLELGELVAAGCTVVFIMHLAFKRATLNLGNLSTILVFLAFAWTVVIYVLNPIGFAMFGSETVGFRDYQRIILGVCSFLVMANQQIGEKEAKWLVIITVGSTLIGLAWNFLYIGILGGEGGVEAAEEGNQYTWHQELSGPAFMVALWLFCRYRNSQVFSISKPGLLPLFFFCLVVGLFSGKRAVVASTFFIPAFTAILRKEWAHFLVYSLGAVLAVSILVVGHGNIFDLPYRVQRSMANLPGNWDPDIRAISEEGGDSFRTTMRELAWEKIKLNPIVGKGLGFNWADTAGINAANYMQNIHVALALGNSWHNTWLGLWADFGLPAVIFHAFIMINFLVVLFSNYRKTNRSSQLGIYSMMLLIITICALLRSYTSGSSNIAFTVYWQFGAAVGIAATLRVQAVRPSVSSLKTGALAIN